MSSIHYSDSSKREVASVHGGATYQGDFFDKEGYLEKQLKISSIESKLINPTLEEITKFSGGVVNERGDELAMLAKSNLANAEDFHISENVIAIAGEAKNVFGIVKSIANGIVTVVPDKSFKIAVIYLSDILGVSISCTRFVKTVQGR
jgi:transcription elongation factor SPT5